jgi:transposase
MHSQLNQIGLGFILNQKQINNMDETKDILLSELIELITESHDSIKNFDEHTVYFTQEHIQQILLDASGIKYSKSDIKELLEENGFELHFMSNGIIESNFYWLMKPKI